MSEPTRHFLVHARPLGVPSSIELLRGSEIWMPERRQFIRMAVASPVFISWRRHTIAVTVVDATQSGIRVDAALPQSAVGELIQVNFAGSATLQGEIRWCRDGHLGIRLSSFEHDVLDELRSEYHGTASLTHVVAWQKRRKETLALIQAIDGTDAARAVITAAMRHISHDP